jgi:hypothetical protein
VIINGGYKDLRDKVHPWLHKLNGSLNRPLSVANQRDIKLLLNLFKQTNLGHTILPMQAIQIDVPACPFIEHSISLFNIVIYVHKWRLFKQSTKIVSNEGSI